MSDFTYIWSFKRFS